MNEIEAGYCHCGCGRKTRKRGRRQNKFLRGHNICEMERVIGEDHPKWKGGRRITDKGYILILSPTHPRAKTLQCVPEHVLIAERALGKFLPKKNPVHHFNEIKSDNTNSNLVICEAKWYHHLLHQRKRAYLGCGHAHWRKCKFCGKYDDPTNLNGDQLRHRECINAYNKTLVQRKNNEGGRQSCQMV